MVGYIPTSATLSSNQKSTAMNGLDAQVLNYVTANHFYVEIEEQLTACFTSCQGLSAKINTTLLKEGGVNDHQRILLGPTSYTEVTLSRGITNSLLFWNWLQAAMQGGTNIRRHVNILVFSQAGETIQCWALRGAVPVGWKAAQLQASSTGVAVEELSLAYESLNVTANTKGNGATFIKNGRGPGGFF